MIEKSMGNSDKGGSDDRLFTIKTYTALFVGKLLLTITRLLGRGGTTLPGRIALMIKPDLVKILARQIKTGSIVVTGTNGKTTTSALLTSILKEAGLICINNQSGSNMSWGVASAFVEKARISGKIPVDYAILEVDEGAFPAVTAELQPRAIVVTNIFRDQLDRYGEIDYIQNAIQSGLEFQPGNSLQVINADDPSLVALSQRSGISRLTYGLDLNLPDDNLHYTGRDLKTCPLCREELAYERLYYAHLGYYYCPACNFRHPRADVRLTDYSSSRDGSTQLTVKHPKGSITLTSNLTGRYNLYNILAALTCSLGLGIQDNFIVSAIEKAAPSFGRMEHFFCEEKNIIMALIKNPVGANEVIRTVLSMNERFSLMVAINDKIADGKDVSWLWDVDFEQLTARQPNISSLTASGLRAWDMAVRFKYAGFDQNKIEIDSNTEAALIAALDKTPRSGTLFILPSYTAMLEIRRHLNKMGMGKPYWEA